MQDADFRQRIIEKLWNGRPLDEQDTPDRPQTPEPEIRALLRGLRWLTDIAQPTLTIALRELIAARDVASGSLAYRADVPSIELCLDPNEAGEERASQVVWSIAVAQDGSIEPRSASTGRTLPVTDTVRSAGPNLVISVVIEAEDEVRGRAWRSGDKRSLSA